MMEINVLRQVAQQLGLVVHEVNSVWMPSTTLTGIFREVPICVVHQATTLDVRAMLSPPIPFPFVIGPEGFLSKVGHVFGVHDDEIGDPELDAKLKISSPHIGAVKNLITPALREALIGGLHLPFKLTENGASITQTHGRADAPTTNQLIAKINAATHLVRELRQAAIATSAVQPPHHQ